MNYVPEDSWQEYLLIFIATILLLWGIVSDGLKTFNIKPNKKSQYFLAYILPIILISLCLGAKFHATNKHLNQTLTSLNSQITTLTTENEKLKSQGWKARTLYKMKNLDALGGYIKEGQELYDECFTTEPHLTDKQFFSKYDAWMPNTKNFFNSNPAFGKYYSGSFDMDGTNRPTKRTAILTDAPNEKRRARVLDIVRRLENLEIYGEEKRKECP